jgi:plastocyanin
MRRIPAIVLVVIVTTTLIGAGIAYSADRTVRTRGDNHLVPNALIQSTLKFAPGNTVARTGDTVTWVHADKTTEPHTITIVNEEELPQTIEEVFEPDCPSCDVAAQGHFVQGLAFVDVDGDGGLNTPGDSLFLPPGGQVSAEITAEGGDSLSYLCIIHP